MQQQIDDSTKHGIDALMSMEHVWGSLLGRMVFEDCKLSLKRPMRLLALFEAAGKAAEERDEFLSWNVPITHFPVKQMYTEGKVKKTWVQYGPPKGEKKATGYYENSYQLMICYLEDLQMMRGKQAQGASPNAIHSLDAAHLMITVSRADFSITTIHDSFGALLCDMPKLYTLIRQTFVELYEADPLGIILTQIGADVSSVEVGTLDIRDVLESEYCFS